MFLGDFYFGGVDLSEKVLESLTRWDSIEAPHQSIEVDGKTRRNWGEARYDAVFEDSTFTVTEKIDGTNMAWVVFLTLGEPDLYFIRSRKEFLMFSTDLLVDDKFGAVTALIPNEELILNLAQRLSDSRTAEMLCFYGELYGPGIQKGGKYGKNINWRLFGAKRITPEFAKWFVEVPREEHHRHRWKGFIDQDTVIHHASRTGVPYVPILDRCAGRDFGTVEACKRYLGKLEQKSLVAWDGGGTPEGALEGVVLRCESPFQIYKVKYEGYIL